MLEINALTLKLDNFVRQYDIQVKTKQIALLQGKSGLGKSSLLYAIAGFISAESGDIVWQKQSLLSLPAEKRPVGLLFQDHNLFEHISIRHNLCLAVPTNLQDSLDSIAEDIGIAGQLDKKPHQLSGGQQKRAAMIRALLRPEPLILLDEPFAELDSETHQLCRQWVEKTARKMEKTVILVSHHSHDSCIADQVIQLQ